MIQIKGNYVLCVLLLLVILAAVLLCLTNGSWKGDGENRFEGALFLENMVNDDEYLFSPDELQKVSDQFAGLLVPAFVPERFSLKEFIVTEIDGDYYSVSYRYIEKGNEEDSYSLSIYFCNMPLPSSPNFDFAVYSAEFDKGYVVYHEDPFSDVITASKIWNTGEFASVKGNITWEELAQVVYGVVMKE